MKFGNFFSITELIYTIYIYLYNYFFNSDVSDTIKKDELNKNIIDNNIEKSDTHNKLDKDHTRWSIYSDDIVNDIVDENKNNINDKDNKNKELLVEIKTDENNKINIKKRSVSGEVVFNEIYRNSLKFENFQSDNNIDKELLSRLSINFKKNNIEEGINYSLNIDENINLGEIYNENIQ